ncbi:hypothetical protein T440DRAFT_470549 [Plenodomus tracheiphilus IPT5]|uniref:Uncharacterized protein n=1 Tax=Plenodomus tracheiphilus IPT5 TaxID=1408161 RepID=A0A6A7B0L6_9PLEO|nr:hypothetical protein T440DRAFT_470549 [Plenodomus tracheiphilus IPT5]
MPKLTLQYSREDSKTHKAIHKHIPALLLLSHVLVTFVLHGFELHKYEYPSYSTTTHRNQDIIKLSLPRHVVWVFVLGRLTVDFLSVSGRINNILTGLSAKKILAGCVDMMRVICKTYC